MNIILVPGLWQGGWAWSEVAPILRKAGHNVAAPTLPGLDGPDDARDYITLDDHARIIARIANSMAGPVTLIGHSGGAFVIARACDFATIERCIYVDALPPKTGDVINAALPGNDIEVPLPDREFFGDDVWDFSDAIWQEFTARTCPHPAQVVYAPLTLEKEKPVRSTVIASTFSPVDVMNSPTPVRIVEFNSGHWPHITRPQEFSELLLSVLADEASL